MDYPRALWSTSQLAAHLDKLAHLLQIDADVFRTDMPGSPAVLCYWVDLIREVGNLVQQAEIAGRRISFTEEVCYEDPARDITSLLETMRQSAYLFRPALTQPGLTILSPRMNQLIGASSGRFRNGLFFVAPTRMNAPSLWAGTGFIFTGI